MTTTRIPVTTGVVTVATVAGGYAYLELDKGTDVVGPPKVGVSVTGQEALTLGQALMVAALELLGGAATLEHVMRGMIADIGDLMPPADPDAGLVEP